MYHNGFMDIATVKESESGTQTSDMARPQRIELKGEELKDFISTVVPDWCRPLRPPNLKLEDAMTRSFEAELASGRLTKDELIHVKEWIPMCCHFSDMCFYSFPLEVKLLIAMYTAVLFQVDDLIEDGEASERKLRELQRFVNNYGDESQAHQTNPHLNHCYRLLTVEFPKYYGPFATSNIIQSTINFIIGTMLEIRYPKGVTCPKTSSRYLAYVRQKSGLSEAYAYFLFPNVIFPEEEYLETFLPTIPDIQMFIERMNDFLSFYKEVVVGAEETTYLMTTSKFHGCSPVDMWRETFKQIPPLAREISATLSRREELLTYWEQYRDGYIRWHIGCPRYRLAEIGVTCLEQ